MIHKIFILILNLKKEKYIQKKISFAYILQILIFSNSLKFLAVNILSVYQKLSRIFFQQNRYLPFTNFLEHDYFTNFSILKYLNNSPKQSSKKYTFHRFQKQNHKHYQIQRTHDKFQTIALSNKHVIHISSINAIFANTNILLLCLYRVPFAPYYRNGKHTITIVPPTKKIQHIFFRNPQVDETRYAYAAQSIHDTIFFQINPQDKKNISEYPQKSLQLSMIKGKKKLLKRRRYPTSNI
eukprot:TRINITY_DN3465_c1_g1_i4.p2 TRINITY_DN3465_c1_g1~~TRINITY_DN3465_c1_g1_i4.p2  ORF type:complete len:239 (-),score=-13.56 TRINITY_DN3465_c1_g1_i4:531-1247(-)